jgi:hypothetical protein
MKTKRLIPFFALLVSALGFALPGSAVAKTFCVNEPACPADATTYADLQTALTAARNNVSADEILLGEGVYTGTFYYESNEKLILRGADRAKTILRDPTSEALIFQGDDATATNLRIESGNNYGVRLNRGKLDGVTVSVNGSDNTAVLAFGGSSIINSSLTSQSGDALRVTENGATDKTVVKSSSLIGVSAGLRNVATQPVNLEITSSRLQGGSALNFADGKLVLKSSVLRGFHGMDLGGGSDVTASNLTIDGQGNGTGIDIGTNSLDDSKIDITSSIISRFERGFVRTGSSLYDADVNVRYTMFQGLLQSGDGSFVQEHNPAWETPPFVAGNSVIPNLQLVAPSSLVIDAGEPGLGLGASDANGRLRLVDGDGDGTARVDLGAFEYQRSAPEVTIEGPDRIAPGEELALTATSTDLDPTEAGKHQYSWDYGSTSPKIGKEFTNAWPNSGRQEITLTVTDPGGRETVVTKEIMVGDDEGPGNPVDTLAPVISSFTPSTKRIKLGQALIRKVKTKKGSQLRLKLSEAASIRLTFERKRKGKFRALKGGIALDGLEGLNRIRFQGRISKKRTLKPGAYRVTAVATDAAGNRSKQARTRFTLHR